MNKSAQEAEDCAQHVKSFVFKEPPAISRNEHPFVVFSPGAVCQSGEHSRRPLFSGNLSDRHTLFQYERGGNPNKEGE